MSSASSVYIPKDHAIDSLFGRRKAVIGVIHALPLPGSSRYDGGSIETVYDHAVAEARRYRENGVDGLIVENHGDIPFAKPDEIGPETAAAMAVMTDRVRVAVGGPIGINVLANAPITALACAKASGADFIRVNQWANAYVANEGFMEGRAGTATRYRSWIGARDVRVFADVHVKHGAHAIVADRPLEEMARDAVLRRRRDHRHRPAHANGAYLRSAVADGALFEARWRTCEAATDISTIWVAEGGENMIVSSADCARSVEPKEVPSLLDGFAADDFLVVQGNLESKTTVAACRHALGRGGRTVVNTASINWPVGELLHLVDLVVCNRPEAEAIAGAAQDEPGRIAAMARGAVVLTQTTHPSFGLPRTPERTRCSHVRR